MAELEIYFGDNLPILQTLPACSFDLIYIDPPFNTGKKQLRTKMSTIYDENGDRTGFQGRRYRTVKLSTSGYLDMFNDYLAFLAPRLEEARRLLKQEGSLFFHIDYREAHYCKVLLDEIFGRTSFINELIWVYDYGARSKKRWSPKHDTIFWYAKNPSRYTFNYEVMDRIPYMAPGLVGPEKAARGKTPTDVWWNTIVSPNGREKTGYATQKPRAIVERILKVHSNPGDRVCDFFAGSGTLGEAAQNLGRDCLLIDSNPEAWDIMQTRFAHTEAHWFCGDLQECKRQADEQAEKAQAAKAVSAKAKKTPADKKAKAETKKAASKKAVSKKAVSKKAESTKAAGVKTSGQKEPALKISKRKVSGQMAAAQAKESAVALIQEEKTPKKRAAGKAQASSSASV